MGLDCISLYIIKMRHSLLSLGMGWFNCEPEQKDYSIYIERFMEVSPSSHLQ